MQSSNVTVIIVAAGNGTRFGSELPKQFCLLRDKPVVIHAVERFRQILPDADIIVVVASDRVGYWLELASTWSIDYVHAVAGGATRWQSVKNALDILSPQAEIILVHDGARPLVQPDVVARLLNTVTTADGALPVLPMTDSLRQTDTNGCSHAVDRTAFHAVQTPQAFPAETLRHAYTIPYKPTMTDDASVIEAAGFSNIILCEGSDATLKITRPLDLAIATLYLQAENDATSSGF